jgi:hypothetical protein
VAARRGVPHAAYLVLDSKEDCSRFRIHEILESILSFSTVIKLLSPNLAFGREKYARKIWV